MRALVVGLGALALVGCWDFQQARSNCEGLRTCSRGGDAGAFDVVLPQWSPAARMPNANGRIWEYPFPAVPGLHAVAAVSDQELWATGDEDFYVHLKHGEAPELGRLPAGASNLRNSAGAAVIALPDGRVLFAGEGSLHERTGSEWTRRDWAFSPSVADVGLDGAPWFAGVTATASPCATGSGVVVEGTGYPGGQSCLADTTIVGLDFAGWALDRKGRIFQRLDAGWAMGSALGALDRGDILEVGPGEVLVVGNAAGLPALVNGARQSFESQLVGPAEDRGGFASAVRLNGGGLLMVGTAGAFSRAAGAKDWKQEPLAAPTKDAQRDLEAVAAGPLSEYAVGLRGQVLRRVDGTWKTLLPGGTAPVVDTLQDQGGVQWLIAANGAVLKRGDAGWVEETRLGTEGRGLTQLVDGGVWLAGRASLTTQSGGVWTDTGLVTGGGSPLPLDPDVDLEGIAGRAPGNTWAYGNYLYGYDGTGWRKASLQPTTPIVDLFTTEQGTAFAVNNLGKFLFFDAVSWSEVSDPTSEPLRAVWAYDAVHGVAASDHKVYWVNAEQRFIKPAVTADTAALTGYTTASNDNVIIGGAGNELWWLVGIDLTLKKRTLDLPFAIHRLRVIGDRLYVSGAPDDPRSVLVSYPLPF